MWPCGLHLDNHPVTHMQAGGLSSRPPRRAHAAPCAACLCCSSGPPHEPASQRSKHAAVHAARSSHAAAAAVQRRRVPSTCPATCCVRRQLLKRMRMRRQRVGPVCCGHVGACRGTAAVAWKQPTCTHARTHAARGCSNSTCLHGALLDSHPTYMHACAVAGPPCITRSLRVATTMAI